MPSGPKPALAVVLIAPEMTTLPMQIAANGSIAAWQEASVGTEANGLRLVDVRANVGDHVQRGQVLAVFDGATVAAELAHSQAVMAEAEAALADAQDDARRARELQTSGALSERQIHQALTTERMMQARLQAARAAVDSQTLHLAQTRVLAPDDGIIVARSATVGAVLPAGQELFRLIRRGRLEWRAEVPAPELARLRPHQIATVTPVGGEPIKGMVRMVAPAVDTQTRSGLIYVDLPAGSMARAGMFARGEIAVGMSLPALTLPQAAVLQRDGFHYVLRVGTDSRVLQTKIKVGRRTGDRVEIVAGIHAGSRVVAAGGAFLGDGDLVRVVAGQASAHKWASDSSSGGPRAK